MGYWKEKSLAVISDVLKQLPEGASEQEKRKALSKAYPFGERRMHPYKVWCDLVNLVFQPKPQKKSQQPSEEQLSLF